jgi:hypothetical protein
VSAARRNHQASGWITAKPAGDERLAGLEGTIMGFDPQLGWTFCVIGLTSKFSSSVGNLANNKHSNFFLFGIAVLPCKLDRE